MGTEERISAKIAITKRTGIFRKKTNKTRERRKERLRGRKSISN